MLKAFRGRSLPPPASLGFKQPSRAEHCPSGPEVSILWPIDSCLALLRNLDALHQDIKFRALVGQAQLQKCVVVPQHMEAVGHLVNWGAYHWEHACGVIHHVVLITHWSLSKWKQNRTQQDTQSQSEVNQGKHTIGRDFSYGSLVCDLWSTRDDNICKYITCTLLFLFLVEFSAFSKTCGV